MPQPLSHVKHHGEIVMDPEALAKRPALGALVMKVIAYWSHVEVQKSHLLSVMIRSHRTIGLAIYQSVRSPAAQRAILDAAASEGMPEKHRPLFFAVMEAIAASARRRHAFAHHLWGYCRDLKDALLLVDPKTHVKFSKALLDHEAGRIQIIPLWPNYDLSQIMVYTKEDLRNDVEDASRAEDWLMLVGDLCNHIHAGSARNELLSDPRIEQCIRTPSPSVGGTCLPPDMI